MEFIEINNLQLPKTCPNCGIGNNPKTIELGSKAIGDGYQLQCFHHTCLICKKFHITIQKTVNNTVECVSVYPNKVISMDIPEVLRHHAPVFSEYYSEALQAERDGLYNLAGMGYRVSIEALIKEYALDFGLSTEIELKKLSFYEATSRFIENDEWLKQSVDVIRKIGNDFAHWDSKYNLPLYELKSYVDVVVTIFISKFKMKYTII